VNDLEPPEERGDKSSCGLLSLRAELLGDSLEIEVSDDGRGIDLQAVLRRAVASHRVSADAASGLSQAEILDLVFVDGLSTKDEVSETSGRGIGLSAVRDAVRAAGGSIQIQTERGRGTRMTLRVPRVRPRLDTR